jgi:hypothetical protein
MADGAGLSIDALGLLSFLFTLVSATSDEVIEISWFRLLGRTATPHGLHSPDASRPIHFH